jgi:DNA helicase-2/ATP-dependent DNA helicase PcrA
MKIDYEKALNSAQYEAVTQEEGIFLVIAGAGSGKTRTLVYRVARLVESGVPPESILLLTFTRKASLEMLHRSSMLADDRCNRVSGGTFHSMGNLLLRKYGSAIGLNSSFTILDSSDAQDSLNLLKNEKGYGKKIKHFPKKSTISAILSFSINKREPLNLVLAKAYPQFLFLMEEITQLQTAYFEYKKKHNLVDYDDLLVLFKELLEAPEIQEKVQCQYRFLMVDEYQDTNILQAEIINLLGRGHNNIMAVGDPAQCIYSFRGANSKNILEFERLFPGLKVIKLEENYRSTQKILDACNALMIPAREKFAKNLFSKTQKGKELPVVVGSGCPSEEAYFIVDTVEEITRTLDLPLNDIAVLFRNSFHSYELELELNKRNIPFVKYGGFKFVETSHIKDMVSHLRVVANPKDTVSWTRLLLLMEGMGPKTASKTIRQIQTMEDPFALSKLKGLEKFHEHFKELEQLFLHIMAPGRPPSIILERVLEYYNPILEDKYDDFPRRKKDLDQFLSITEKYKGLEQLLADMALEPPNASKNGTLADSQAKQEHLVLSTVHSAKGLEWHTVFVMGANEGSFPNSYAIEDDEELEEERRLFYVAATRAKERLYFTFSTQKKDRYGNFYPTYPSQFLHPLRENGLVKKVGSWSYF